MGQKCQCNVGEMMSLLFLTVIISSLQLSSSGNKLIDPPKPTCITREGKIVSSGDVWTEGCLVHTCNNGRVETELSGTCVQLIEKQVSIIMEKKLGQKCEKEARLKETDPVKLETSGIIVAGGDNQKQVKLFKPDSKEVCDLPDLPEPFCFSSINLVEGSPVLCGSCDDDDNYSWGEKNEINSERSCIQLSPASKAAEWKIYAKNIPLHKYQVSMATTEGILLMGAYGSKGVTLVKPDGTSVWGIFFLKRSIEGACGIEDEDSLIITGGKWINTEAESVTTKTVDRYNSKGFVEDLPEMKVARQSHGCGYLYQEGKKVLVVAGGYQGQKFLRWVKDDDDLILSPTETLTLGENAWKMAAPLPKPMHSFGSTSLNGKIYFIGIEWNRMLGDYSSIEATMIQYDGEEWTETLKESYNPMNHNSRGNRAIALDLKTSGFNEFCH